MRLLIPLESLQRQKATIDLPRGVPHGSRLLLVQWAFPSCLHSSAAFSVSVHPVVRVLLAVSSITVETRCQDDAGKY
jgi:hypothetical protein